MIYARNNQEVSHVNFTEERTYTLDSGVTAYKLSVQVLAEDAITKELKFGPVIVQVTEEPQHLFEDNLGTEQFLELGFNSRGFATPITGARFRIPTVLEGVPEVKPAKIHLVFYG
jgi:hypothetical protein